MLGHGVYLGVQFLLNLHHILLVSLSDEVDSQANLTVTTTSTDPVEVGASFCWEVEVDDHID